MNLQHLAQYINQLDPQPAVYIGVDSELDPTTNTATYTTAVVLHSQQVSEVYGTVQTQKTYGKASDPYNRLRQEAYILAQAYLDLAQHTTAKIELHLDLNPDPKFKSNRVVKESLGYVAAVTGQAPRVKPHSWAASTVADRLKEILARSPHKKFA